MLRNVLCKNKTVSRQLTRDGSFDNSTYLVIMQTIFASIHNKIFMVCALCTFNSYKLWLGAYLFSKEGVIMACLYAPCIHRSIRSKVRWFFFAMSSPLYGCNEFPSSRWQWDLGKARGPVGRPAAVDRHLILILPHKKKKV